MDTMFLKKVDAVAGRLAAALVPRPVSSSLPEVCREILVIRPGGIGDAILLIPALVALKKKYPAVEITVLAERRNAAAFSLTSVVDEVLIYHRPGDLLSVLQAEFDVVVDTEQWHRLSSVVARFSRSSISIGFATNNRERLFTHPVPYFEQDHEIVSFFRLFQPLGIVLPQHVPCPFLSIPESAVIGARRLLGPLLEDPFIVIFPGTTVPEKQWGIERFRDLVSKLMKDHCVVVLGGSKEVENAVQIVADGRVINLAGKSTLAESAAVIQRAKLVVSGDSGILHLAHGVGTPSVSLFGPSNASKWAPNGKMHITLHHAMPCAPCSRFGYTPSCRFGTRCMTEISVGEVNEAINFLLHATAGEHL